MCGLVQRPGWSGLRELPGAAMQRGACPAYVPHCHPGTREVHRDTGLKTTSNLHSSQERWPVSSLACHPAGACPHVSRHLNDSPSCAQTAVQVCSTPHASLRPRAGWAQAELRRPHNPTPKPGLLLAK